MARIAFLGSPGAAVPTLRALDQTHDVALVVTRPDRPKGRSGRPVPTEVAVAASDLGLPIARPGSAADLAAALDAVADLDLGVVVAYGRILRPAVLRIPSHGLLNLHFSLLPRWRGAAPVARALIAGDPMTGVTVMKLDEGLDTGPVLTAQAVDILGEEDAGELTARLANLGADLLARSIHPYLAGELTPVAQSSEGVTYAEKIGAADRPIDPAALIVEIIGQVRGLAPAPAATLAIDGERHKVLAVGRSESSPAQGRWHLHEGWPVIGVADGGVVLRRLQPPGKKVMSGEAWGRGRHTNAGSIS